MTPIERLEALIEPMQLIVGKFPGFEPESLKLQPAMVNAHELQKWEAELRAIVEELKQRDEAVRKVMGEMEFDANSFAVTPDRKVIDWAIRLRAALEGKHD